MCDFVVGTRFYRKKGELYILEDFVEQCLSAGAKKVFVAVREDRDHSGCLQAKWPKEVDVYPVYPWFQFVPALNSLFNKSREYLSEGSKILIASPEVTITSDLVISLSRYLVEGTLAAGPVLKVEGYPHLGHDFKPGYEGPVNGLQIPWNTCTLYDPKDFWPILFLNIGEGLLGDSSEAGVEEYSAMALAQRLYGVNQMKVKLVKIPNVKWEIVVGDEQRSIEKMLKKASRPARQLERLGIYQVIAKHIA